MDARHFGAKAAWRGSMLLALLALASAARGGDWPQILGPNRDGKAHEESLLASWPKAGPKILWRAKLGSGYAGLAVADGKAVAFHRVGDVERVQAFDAATGKSLWQADFDALYRGGIDPDIGPRCVPLIDNEIVYVFGAGGDLHAVELTGGNKRWSRSLYADYQGDEGFSVRVPRQFSSVEGCW